MPVFHIKGFGFVVQAKTYENIIDGVAEVTPQFHFDFLEDGQVFFGFVLQKQKLNSILRFDNDNIEKLNDKWDDVIQAINEYYEKIDDTVKKEKAFKTLRMIRDIGPSLMAYTT